MRRAVLVLMLALAAFAGLAPALEAGCAEECADDAPDLCCSCCVHFKVDAPRVAAALVDPAVSRPSRAPLAVRPASPDPRDILHVPKTALL
jgi:hypothetical protein